MGVGRSTLGMVVSCLVLLWLSKLQGHPMEIEQNSHLFPFSPSPSSPSSSCTSKVVENYRPVQDLQRVTRNGVECKRIADAIIDMNDECVNLRRVVGEMHQQVLSFMGMEDKGKGEQVKRILGKGNGKDLKKKV